MKDTRGFRRDIALIQRQEVFEVFENAERAYTKAMIALYPSDEFSVGDNVYRNLQPSLVGAIIEWQEKSRRWFVRWETTERGMYFADEITLVDDDD